MAVPLRRRARKLAPISSICLEDADVTLFSTSSLRPRDFTSVFRKRRTLCETLRTDIVSTRSLVRQHRHIAGETFAILIYLNPTEPFPSNIHMINHILPLNLFEPIMESFFSAYDRGNARFSRDIPCMSKRGGRSGRKIAAMTEVHIAIYLSLDVSPVSVPADPPSPPPSFYFSPSTRARAHSSVYLSSSPRVQVSPCACARMHVHVHVPCIRVPPRFFSYRYELRHVRS